MNTTYQYSNGLDLLRVLPALVGRLKWTPAVVTTENASKSGRYFDDNSFHSMVTEAMLKDLQPTPGISEAAFVAFKDKFEKAAIMKALNAVFPRPLLIEKTLLHAILPEDRPSQLPDALFVGYKVVVAETYDMLQQIETAVLHFDADTAVKLYLFKEGEALSIWDETVNAVGGKYSVVDLKDCFLSYGKEKATTYYFGYKPSELLNGAKPFLDSIRYDYTTCTYETCLVTASAIPIYEQKANSGSYANGLNLEVSAMYDNTVRVVKSAFVFDELVGLINAAMILELGLFNNRRNATERKAADSIDKLAAQLDLMGAVPVTDGPTTEGLRAKIKNEVLKVQKSFVRKQNGVITI